VTVAFNQLIDPSSLGPRDIQLARADDGGLTPLDNATVILGPSGNQLELTPGQQLTPGYYQVVLTGGSGLLSVDGDSLDGDGTDQFLGEFRIVSPGVGLGDAVDLGTPRIDPVNDLGFSELRREPF